MDTLPGKVLSIMLVEDNEIDVELCKHALTKAGIKFTVDVATNEEQLIKLLLSRSYDLVISDYTLQCGWCGPMVLKVVRSIHKDLPFVLATGTLDTEKAVECIKAGMNDYVLKDRIARLPVIISKVLTEHELMLEAKRAQEVEARLASIVECSEDAIISTTADGVIASWNHGAEMLYGYTADDIIGSLASVIIPSDKLDEAEQAMQQALQGEPAKIFETVRMHKDGTCVPVSIRISAIKDRLGNITGCSSIARDITERLQAEGHLYDSEARMRAIVNTVLDAIIVTNGGGKIIEFNPAAEKIFGHKRDRMLGKLIVGTIVSHTNTGQVQLLRQCFKANAGTAHKLVVTGIKADNTQFQAEMAVNVMDLDGRRIITICMR